MEPESPIEAVIPSELSGATLNSDRRLTIVPSKRGLDALRHVTKVLRLDADASLSFLEGELKALRADGDAEGVVVVATHAAVHAFALRKYELAAALWGEAAELRAEDPYLHSGVGHALERAGHLEEARAAFQRCLDAAAEVDPELAAATAARLRDLERR
jgi:Flp pilus assembly protein TadD